MKEISLTQGKVALIDDDDYEWVSQFKWYASVSHGIFYVRRDGRINKKKVRFYLHREILKRNLKDSFDKNLFVDHKNHNGLDNRKENLRLVTNRENLMNRGDSHFCSSIYPGVRRTYKKYAVYAQFNGKNNYLGTFEDELKAAIVYMQAVYGPNYLYE